MAIQKEHPQSGIDGPYRNRSVVENLTLFEAMKNGDYQKEVMCYVLRLICHLQTC
jgi:glutaminyl-tRNA synthetase